MSFIKREVLTIIILLSILLTRYQGIAKSQMGFLMCAVILQRFLCKIIFKKVKGSEHKKIVAFNIVLIMVFWSLLPHYTYKEAKERVTEKYRSQIEKYVEFKDHSDNTIHVGPGSFLDVTSTSRFYYFTIIKKNTGKKMGIKVNPQDGTVTEVQETDSD